MSLFIMNDDSFIYKLGLAILISLEKKLSDDNMDQVAITLNNLIKLNTVVRIINWCNT